MNIILIISDTLRQDHLGCYGNKNIITPYIDQFSEECIKFNNAYAASFPTMPCRADLFTGKYTFTYLGWNPLTGEETVLSEILSKSGYTNLAAVDTPFLIRFGYGYDRGFKDFVFISGQDRALDRLRVMSLWRFEEDRFAPRTIIKAEKLLEYYYKDKFFLYIDIWDPHEPWDAPEYYTKLYKPDYNGEDHKFPAYGDWKEVGNTEEEIKLSHDCYCGEITMVDRWIGRLLDKIKKLGLWDDTIIIFVSDHGFCFGEHGMVGKARSGPMHQGGVLQGVKNILFKESYNPVFMKIMDSFCWTWSPIYQEIAKIPLLIKIPGQKSKTMDNLISAVDIMPTILDFAKVEIPASVQGKSIKPLIDGKVDSIRDFVIASYPLYNVCDESRIVDGLIKKVDKILPSTIADKNWTMYYSDSSTPVELYNIKDDPKQLNNIYEKNKEVAKDLHSKFYKLLEQVKTREDLLETRKGIIK